MPFNLKKKCFLIVCYALIVNRTIPRNSRELMLSMDINIPTYRLFLVQDLFHSTQGLQSEFSCLNLIPRIFIEIKL